MGKKKMTKKGTRILRCLLAAVCAAVLVLGLMPGNLGTMSVQAEGTKINLTAISTNMNYPTNVPVGSIIENNQNVDLKISIYAAINDWDNSSAYDFVVTTLKIDEAVTIHTSYSQGNSRTISANIWQAYYDYSSDQVRMWPAADTKTATTTTLSAESITVTEGETWTLTAQAKAGNTDVAGATVVYYSDEDCKRKLDAEPTAVGTYYARGEYYGSDSYEASNSEIITVTIKEKTPQKGEDYDYTMAELLEKGTTKLAAGTKIYLDSEIYAEGQVGGSYEYGIANGYITYDSSKVQNYETYKLDRGYLVRNQGYYTDRYKGKIITLTNSYTYLSSPNKTITGEEWYVNVEVVPFGNYRYRICIMPTSPTEGYIKEVTAPTISDDGQPANASVKSGGTATFTVTATGDELTYQWQIDRNDGKGFVNIDGATAASYRASAVDVSDSGFKYHCIVTNTAGSVTSNVAILTVTADEPEPHTHTLVYHAEVAATTIKAGTKAYWQCSDCGKYFSDAEGKTEIEKPEIIPIIAAKDDGSDKGSDNGSDGKDATTTTTTTETATTDTTGTTTSGSAAANTAAASDSPKTGDGTPLVWIFVVLLGSAAGLFGISGFRAARREK